MTLQEILIRRSAVTITELTSYTYGLEYVKIISDFFERNNWQQGLVKLKYQEIQEGYFNSKIYIPFGQEFM